jgi:hypothetical protein
MMKSECRWLDYLKGYEMVCRWVPGSARIVVLGAHTKGSGALQVGAGDI